MRFLFIPYILLSIIFFSGSSTAQENGTSLLSRLQTKFDSTKDITADFAEKINGRSNLTGKLYYKQGNKLRLELKEMLIVSDGVTNWNYNKKQNKVVISGYDSSNPSVLSLKELIDEYPDKCTVSEIYEDGNEILALKPKAQGMGFTDVKLWVNAESLIDRAVIQQAAGNTIEIDFSGYKLNRNLSDSKFKFIPPKGSSIIDLR